MDPKRYAALQEHGCVCCKALGTRLRMKVEAHHLVDMGNRKASGGDAATIPLCEWHHRGVPFMDQTKSFMERVFGPALSEGTRAFVKRWGTERELLAKVDAEIDSWK